MAVTVTATPSTGTATKTAFHIAVSGLDDTDFSTYNSANKPAETELRYYFEMSEGGTVKGRSAEFSPDASTGKGVWQGIIVPDSGTYTFSVKNSTTHATKGSVGVTVS